VVPQAYPGATGASAAAKAPVAQLDTRRSPIRPSPTILDRLVHNAYRLTLKGESLRKTAAKCAGLDVKQDA
jgi:hypothetical protein